MKTPYSYTILRYVHDSMTGEFVNVGVVICSPANRFVKAELNQTYGRIAQMFPNFDDKHFKSLVSQLEKGFDQLSAKLVEDLTSEAMPQDALSAATRILPADDSAFQWSPMGSGLSNDLTETLAQLFDRLVLKYDDKNTAESRPDGVIWQSFKKDFEQQKILSHLTPKKIQSADGEIEVIRESEAAAFSARLASRIAEHDHVS